MVTARAYDAEARRTRAERILDAAAEQMERWGYNRLTMDDVAAHAGIGKGTIYLHWKTREALFEAVLQREFGALIGELEAAVRRDPENALPQHLGRFYFLYIMQRPLLRAFFTMDLEVLGKLARMQYLREGRAYSLRHEYLRLLQEHGLVRTDVAPADLAYAFRTIIVGFLLVDPLFQDDQPGLQRKGELLAMTLEGSFGSPHRPSEVAIRQIADHVIGMFKEVAEVTSFT